MATIRSLQPAITALPAKQRPWTIAIRGTLPASRAHSANARMCSARDARAGRCRPGARRRPRRRSTTGSRSRSISSNSRSFLAVAEHALRPGQHRVVVGEHRAGLPVRSARCRRSARRPACARSAPRRRGACAARRSRSARTRPSEPGSIRSATFSRAVRPPLAWRRSTASGRAASSVSARRRSSSARSLGSVASMAELTIADVLAVPATGGYFADDQAAIKAGAVRDGLAYPGERARARRRRSRSCCVLSDGYVAHGDCVSVQYSGVGGREPRLRADDARRADRRDVAPRCAARAGRPRSATGCGRGVRRRRGLRALAGAARRRRAPRRHARWPRSSRAEWGLDGAVGARPDLRPDRRGAPRQRRQDDPQAGRLAPARADQHARAGGGHRRLRALGARPRPAPAPRRRTTRRSCTSTSTACSAATCEDRGDPRRWRRRREPFALRVEHPLDAGSREAQIRALARAARRCSAAASQLVADEWANTVDDIRAFNARRAADVVQIKTPDLGVAAPHRRRDPRLPGPRRRRPRRRLVRGDRAQRPGDRPRRARRGRRPAAGQARDGRRRGTLDRS